MKQKKPMRSILKWLGAILITGVMAVGIWGAIAWNRISGAAPSYDGEYFVEGVQERVRIVRDAYAIPHIVAQSESDAIFGLGFSHAQDRYWQMTLSKHFAQGRLAELFGEAALPSDLYVRGLNLRDTVAETIADLDQKDAARIDAYVAGVNAWLTSENYKRPAEFGMTGLKPEAWTVEDTVFVSLSTWIALLGNVSYEVNAEKLQSLLGPADAQILLDLYPDDGNVALSLEDMSRSMGLGLGQLEPLSDQDKEASTKQVSIDPASQQSNNWAISGSLSRSGGAILAGDPHLRYSMPGGWYLAHMAYNGENKVGGTIPGTPAVYMGHNGYFAFSATINQRDVTDIYIEELNPSNPEQYLTPEGYRNFETRSETFKVRGGKSRDVEFKSSRHGPVLPLQIYDPKPLHGDGVVATLKWTLLSGPATSISGLFRINEAKTTDQFIDAARFYHGVDVNIAFAGRNGDIGLVVMGRSPIRSDASSTDGKLPSAGADEDNDWLGIHPAEHTPFVVNPDSGFVYSANAKVIPDGFPYAENTYHAPPSRQQRIKDLLQAVPKHDYESLIGIQLDSVSSDVQRALPLLLSVNPSDERARIALDYLNSWDGNWRAETPAPLIYAHWSASLVKNLLGDEIDASLIRNWQATELILIAVLSDPDQRFCDDQQTPVVDETCDLQLKKTLDQSLDSLSRKYGPDMKSWSWLESFSEDHPHSGLAELPIVGATLSRAVRPIDGPGVPAGRGAPNVAFYNQTDLTEFTGLSLGPTYRFIVDMSDVDGGRYVTASGQSGHFASKHYDDLLELWKQGQYVQIPTSLEKIDAEYELILTPNYQGER